MSHQLLSSLGPGPCVYVRTGGRKGLGTRLKVINHSHVELKGSLTAHTTYNICAQGVVIINVDAPFLSWVDHPG